MSKVNRKRLILFSSVLITLSVIAFLVIKLAQGYRPDLSEGVLRPTGMLVAKSTPDGAQLWINGKLKSATNTTLNLSPDEYRVEIKRDGFHPWGKILQIKKEVVTQTDAYLFTTYPDLKALTFTGASRPLLSPDGQKVVYAVNDASVGKNGLWVLDLSDRPLGFSREPRQIVASAPGGRDFAQGGSRWSPDSKQILVTLENRPGPKGEVIEENFLLETDRLNPTINLVDVTDQLYLIAKDWEKQEKVRQEAQLKKMPKKLLESLDKAIKDLEFSPDENKILYTATASASIPKEIIPPLPAANTQPEERGIEPGRIYVYDLKEDRNFVVMENEECKIENNIIHSPLSIRPSQSCTLRWFPTSKHLFMVQSDKVNIREYDGTNETTVYSGPFENSFAFPFPSGDRILILTSISKDTPPNLYAISLR